MCTCEFRPLKGLPAESAVVSNESLEVVNKFCYLGDMISELVLKKSIVARIRCGRKNIENIVNFLNNSVY